MCSYAGTSKSVCKLVNEAHCVDGSLRMNQYSLSRPRHKSDTYSNKQDKNVWEAAFSLKVPDCTRCHRVSVEI